MKYRVWVISLLLLLMCTVTFAEGSEPSEYAEGSVSVASEAFDDALIDKAVEEAERLMGEISDIISRQGLIIKLKSSGYSAEVAAAAADNCGVDWNEQALLEAQRRLKESVFSSAKLKNDLMYTKWFTEEEAQYAIDNCGVDWKEQAVKTAQSMLESHPFSRDELISNLVKWGNYTEEEAEYAADNCSIDNNARVISDAQSLLSMSPDWYYSRNLLINDMMEIYDCSQDEAIYAADNCGVDWNEQAVKYTLFLLEDDAYSRENLISKLVEWKQYTVEQAEYAVDNSGIDWNEQAAKAALELWNTGVFHSRESIFRRLVDEMYQFTTEEAIYAVNKLR